MNNSKNELLQFVGGIAMLAVGLFIFSNKVIVHSGIFGGGLYIGGYNFRTGLVMVPFIIGIIWMFASGASFPSKVFTGLSVLFIVAVVIMNTNISLISMTLYEWVIILVLIFGGLGLTAKVLLANNRSGDEDGRRSRRRSNEGADSDIDKALDDIRKKYR